MGAQTKKRQHRLLQDGERRRERGLHDQRIGQVGQDVHHGDTTRRDTERPRGRDVVALTQRQHLAARQPRIDRDRDDADGDHRVLDLRAERDGDRDREQ